MAEEAAVVQVGRAGTGSKSENENIQHQFEQVQPQ